MSKTIMERAIRSEQRIRKRISHNHMRLAETPALRFHRETMTDLYKQAFELTMQTGRQHIVTHIIPLKDENRSGLHTPCNMAVLDQQVFQAKCPTGVRTKSVSKRAYSSEKQARVRMHKRKNRPIDTALMKSQRASTVKIYKQAIRMTRDSETQFTVDHVIPVSHQNISGLHVPWNLQVLSEADNLAKSNDWNEHESV